MVFGRLLSLFGVRANEPTTLVMVESRTKARKDAIDEMVKVLNEILKPDSEPNSELSEISFSFVGITERTSALGNLHGIEKRGLFEATTLKGVRLDALVRFQLQADEPDNLDTIIDKLHGQLLASRDDLWRKGFLRLVVEETSAAEHITALDKWRKTTDYRILYEFEYNDSDGAGSLIAQIPIHSDSEVPNSHQRETTVVTDDMVRWDDNAAPVLSVRGRITIGNLSALVFIPGTEEPSGSITVTRTHEGAAGEPTNFPNLEDFLASVTDPDGAERHAQVTFTSIRDFLNELTPAGDPVMLRDLNDDVEVTFFSYEPFTLTFDRVLHLASVADSLEITYENAAFDQTAVLYMRLTRG